MKRDRIRVAWAWTTVLAAILLASCVFWLVTDQIVDRQRSEAQDSLAAGLEVAARKQAGEVKRLEEERKSLTERSVQRRDRNRWLAYLVAAATMLLVTAGKRYRQLVPTWLPSRDELIRLPRLGEEASAGGAFSKAAGSGVAVPAVDDSVFVDELLIREGTGQEAAIPILQAIQKQYRYLPDEVLRRVCEKSEITPAQMAGSATFYAQFRSSPVGRHVVRLCHGTACHVSGVGQIADELRRRLSMDQDEDTDEEMRFTLDPVACLGCCSLAPVMMVGEETAAHLTPSSAWDALSSLEASS